MLPDADEPGLLRDRLRARQNSDGDRAGGAAQAEAGLRMKKKKNNNNATLINKFPF